MRVVFVKGPFMTKRTRFLARSTWVALLAYTSLLFTCGLAQAGHLPQFGAQSVEPLFAISESSTQADNDEICEQLHDQVFTKQASSAGSKPVIAISHAPAIGEHMVRSVVDLNVSRPPGSGVVPAKKSLGSRLSLVLRI